MLLLPKELLLVAVLVLAVAALTADWWLLLLNTGMVNTRVGLLLVLALVWPLNTQRKVKECRQVVQYAQVGV